MDAFKISFSDFLNLPLSWFYTLINVHAEYAKEQEKNTKK